MSEDWDSVTRIGSKARGPGAGGVDRERVIKGKSAINAAARSGAIIGTEKKYGSSNSKPNVDGQRNAMIDRADGPVAPDKVGRDVGKIIEQKRAAMTPTLTQNELARKCNTTQKVIQDFERGTAAPDQKVFNNLERVLNVILRSKDEKKIGQPKFAPKSK
ncbi:hypothetical protein H2204_004637 [Knufia peltigerae]|uniref:Multiprotein-bridging factor 1 n=1 Tax=Knufia peltigerae TaxID=1002370 RepID=A0AA38Y7J2_9EURO|nr:hypothetical protein H2204_004637 [Knufia peltigerae]